MVNAYLYSFARLRCSLDLSNGLTFLSSLTWLSMDRLVFPDCQGPTQVKIAQ